MFKWVLNTSLNFITEAVSLSSLIASVMLFFIFIFMLFFIIVTELVFEKNSYCIVNSTIYIFPPIGPVPCLQVGATWKTAIIVVMHHFGSAF